MRPRWPRHRRAGGRSGSTATRSVDTLGATERAWQVERRLLRLLEHPARLAPARVEQTDEEGCPRVFVEPVTFDELADAAFGQIREFGSRSAAVVIRMLEVIRDVARNVRTDEERQVLLRHALHVLEGSQTALGQAEDREKVQKRYREALNDIAVAFSRTSRN